MKILLNRACVVKLKTSTVSNIVVINFLHTTVCHNYSNPYMLMRRLAHDYDIMMMMELLTTCFTSFPFIIAGETEKFINNN